MNSVMFTLMGKMKSGKNRVLITRAGHRYAPKEFRAWRDEMVSQICMQLGMDRECIQGDVSLIVDYVHGDLIRRDVDGMLSALFHIIVKAGVIKDDAQVKNVEWHQWPLDRDKPMVRVVLTQLNTDN